jgi:hypothetical protein
MKIYSPLFIAIRVVIYSLVMIGAAEAIFFDAVYPMEEGYFGEISLTEMGAELILFVLFCFYLILGIKWKEIQPVSNIVSLFFLISFIREFNFLIEHWIYPVLLVLAVIAWLVIRDFKKIRAATIHFFSVPASSWFFSGFLVTYIFSRLFGRSKFWRLLYSDESYRLAKAATEEGLELLGSVIMLIGAIEFLLFYLSEIRIKNEKL